jgi:acyl-CoA synthetase (AMP-forming)/AMP-acid ligase II
MHGRANTFVDVVLARVAATPERLAYRFLSGAADDEGVVLSYEALDSQARCVAARLQEVCRPGDRSLLVYPPGLEFVTALMGCLYAGVMAVPLYPPHAGRLERARDHLRATIADATPRALLTVSSIRKLLASGTPPVLDAPGVSVMATDDLAGSGDRCRIPAMTPQTPALLQYTSGSTSLPKGVVVTHGNLLHNSSVIQAAFEVDADACGVIWLPPYHDMGLVGGVLQPAFTGLPVVLMSPFTFLQRPARWVEAIARWRATASGGPNFAYDLVVSRTTPEQRSSLDLRSWRVAFCGAEPVRADTLDRFAAAFAPAGFRRQAFYPCYGLAESTLMVTGGVPSQPPKVVSVDAASLERGRAEIGSHSDAGSHRLVGCGVGQGGQEVRIVDPGTLAECRSGEVGEIWVRGESVAAGYWNRPGETAAVFDARIAVTGEGPFLRTGDLGFLRGDDLFVTGRLKHLIIIDGRNHYPHDIERTTEAAHPRIRAAGAAAFTIDDGGQEQLVVAIEVDRQFSQANEASPDGAAHPIVKAVRVAVARDHDVRIHDVVVLPAGGIPRTSSGKIQRHLCRQAYEARALQALQV